MLSKGSLLGESNGVVSKHLRFTRRQTLTSNSREAFKVTRTKLVHASYRFFVAGRD
jgi:hypothetical protein